MIDREVNLLWTRNFISVFIFYRSVIDVLLIMSFIRNLLGSLPIRLVLWPIHPFPLPQQFQPGVNNLKIRQDLSIIYIIVKRITMFFFGKKKSKGVDSEGSCSTISSETCADSSTMTLRLIWIFLFYSIQMR